MLPPDSAPMNIEFPPLSRETPAERLERKLRQAILDRPSTRFVQERRLLLDESDAAANPRVAENSTIRALRTELMGERAKEKAPELEQAWQDYTSATHPDDAQAALADYNRVRDGIIFSILSDVDHVCYGAERERRSLSDAERGGNSVSLLEPGPHGFARVVRSLGENIRRARTYIHDQNVWGQATDRVESAVRSASQKVARTALGFLDKVQTEYIPQAVATKQNTISRMRSELDKTTNWVADSEAVGAKLLESIQSADTVAARTWYRAFLEIHKAGSTVIGAATNIMQWDTMRRIRSEESRVEFLENQFQDYVTRLRESVHDHESGQGDARLVGGMMRWLGKRANVIGSGIEHLEEKLIRDPEYVQRAMLGAALIMSMAATNPMYMLLYPLKWQIDTAFAIAETVAGSNTVLYRNNQMGHFILNIIGGVIPGGADMWKRQAESNRAGRMETMTENVSVEITNGSDGKLIGKEFEALRRYREGDSRLNRIRQKLRTGLLYAFNIHYIAAHGGALLKR
jgi:hypothetical protein